MADPLEIFLAVAPGLESALAQQAASLGFDVSGQVVGGVTLAGGWPDVWRANLEIRGAARVLVRLTSFRAPHLAQLDKRSKRQPWTDWLRKDVPVKVEVTCRRSKIYHAKAAAQRIEGALFAAGLTLGDGVTLKARIEDDLCGISVDSSGEPLHRRGHKEYVGKAPMRETLASLFLQECGFTGQEPVVDPMCGSGTFVLEAAEIASGLQPGRSRKFAFQDLASFDANLWQEICLTETNTPKNRFFGFDRDDGSIRGATANAVRAGVEEWCHFTRQSVSELTRPDGAPGLVMVNPPYGARIGNRKLLFGLYGALGQVLKDRFIGWRVGLVTSDGGLAKASGLPFLPPAPPVAHGSLKVTLWRTDSL